MKKQFIISCLFLMLFATLNAQISLSNSPNLDIVNSNAFLDASTTFSSEAGANPYVGKGIVIPSVDLENFEFDLTLADGITFPTFFDGMIVYNNATGITSILGNRSSTATDVSPGFYYFSNPTGSATYGSTGDNIIATASGIWTPLGSGSNIKNYTTTPIKTATAIDGAQVWAVKGSFTIVAPTALAVATAVVSIPKPDGITGYYKMTTYLGGKTFRSDISSLTIDPLDSVNVSVVTGNGLFSEVYPVGNYTYTLEYFK
jgi:hypothetical protein